MIKKIKAKKTMKNKKVQKKNKLRINFFKKIPSILSFIFSKMRLILRVMLLAIIAFFIGVIILVNNIDPNKYKSDLQKALEFTLNRPVKIEGDIKWKLISFEPAIKMGKISISNTTWGKSKNIFEADNIVVKLSFKHLILRKISVETILIENPKLNLEISTKGTPNWDFKRFFKTDKPTISDIKDKIKEDEQALAKAINYPKFQIAIKSIQIKNGQISYDNRKEKINEKIILNNFLVYSRNYDSPTFIDIIARYKDRVIDGSFKTYSILDMIKQTKIMPLTGAANINGLEFYIISQITDVANFESLFANITVKAPDLQTSLKGLVNLPKIDDVIAQFELILTPKIASIKNLDLTYNAKANLTGDIDIVLNKKPDIKANLYIPEFDIPKLFYPLWEPAYFERLRTGTEKPKGKHKQIENPKAFKDIPLPIDELNWANVILQLNIKELKAMPEMPITNIKLNANINDGNAIIAPLSFSYMGGNLALDILANNKNNTFNGDVSIRGTDVNIGDIIASTGYKDIFKGGNTNIDIVLKGTGHNLEEFMKTLNGYVKVYTTSDLTGYKIENLVKASDVISSLFKFVGEDIIGGIARKDKKKEESTIECAVVNLNVQDGKSISNRGIAIQTKIANIIVDGVANLGDEYLDVSVITIVKEGFGVSNSLAEMIKIQGAMAKPSVIISKDGVIKNVVKTSLATVLAGIFTGGVTLITAGVGMITKSWIENISADKNPCLTAFEGKEDKKKKSATEDFGKQVILRENLAAKIKEESKALNDATFSNIRNTKNEVKKKASK